MSSLLDDFAGLLDDGEQEDSTEISKENIQKYNIFASSKQLTYSGVYRDSIISCISIEESVNIPWKHVCITLDVSKLRDISKPRLSQFYIPEFVEEIRGIGDTNNSGFGYNEYGRNHLKSVIIPSSVSAIANRTFSFYRKLESVNIQENSRLRVIGDEAFTFCEDLIEVDISKCNKLDSLGNRLFEGSNIKKLRINSSIRRCTPETFEGCNIKTIYIDDHKYTFREFMNRLVLNDYEAFWM